MTNEIRETKLMELEQVEDAISYLLLRIKQCKSLIKALTLPEERENAENELEGFKFLLKPKKVERKKLKKELLYTLQKPTNKEIKKAMKNILSLKVIK